MVRFRLVTVFRGTKWMFFLRIIGGWYNRRVNPELRGDENEQQRPKLLALFEDDKVLEFIVDEGVICPSCNQDFLVCLANEPPDCSVLALTPEQLLSGGYARTIKWEDLTENDRFVKNFTKQKWPERPSENHNARDTKEPRLLIEMSDGRLLEFILDDGVGCPSCNQDFYRCLVACAFRLPKFASCTTFDLTPEQLVSNGYARFIAREDVTENDRLVTDFPAFLEGFKRNLINILKTRQAPPNG